MCCVRFTNLQSSKYLGSAIPVLCFYNIIGIGKNLLILKLTGMCIICVCTIISFHFRCLSFQVSYETYLPNT